MGKGDSGGEQMATVMAKDASPNGDAAQVVVPVGPRQRVSRMQAELHSWAAADPGRRFDDLFNLVHDPATVRVGQAAFKALVQEAYGRRCAITGDKIVPVLQAAHIRPVTDHGENRVDNGLLLRSDVHTLFDRGYLGVHPDRKTLLVSPRLRSDWATANSSTSARPPATPSACPPGEPTDPTGTSSSGTPTRSSSPPDTTTHPPHPCGSRRATAAAPSSSRAARAPTVESQRFAIPVHPPQPIRRAGDGWVQLDRALHPTRTAPDPRFRRSRAVFTHRGG
jgi:hypothetical protein